MVNILFYICAVAAIASALGVVSARSPINSVLSLLGTFFSLAVIYLLAGFQFMAAIQILVYGGAIMVLFLFVIMLLNLGNPEQVAQADPLFKPGRATGVALAVSGAALLLGLLAAHALPADHLSPVPAGSGRAMIETLADAIFGKYVLPFEVASVMLLAAAVGVLVLAKRERPGLLDTEAEDNR
ncbi:MAG: NADH-quinone oxidoreductase subunit J [Planctomycetota bacterium]|jgi:NADH-quinone oxidoreductase subunit J|nr:NADH-quinone oxidoreductase subunit J [Planctomycetota bacterium]MDP6519040.1 NADH-quinone oxidoreductase subunit J [Planctomycetota bacterium]MDP6837984.1 NADH-quinone oxidoreductase subunit J [Planctomycetota bacterium]MDP6956776.1 NADH-quinone oxidoreductase subunit J [Planctomycetota bacterium]